MNKAVNYAFFKDKFVPIEAANVNIKTHAFMYGTAIFEGIRAYWNPGKQEMYIFRLREHIARMFDNMKFLYFESKYSQDEMFEIVVDLMKIIGAYANTALAKTDAVRAGFDECIVLTEDGHVSEGSAMNVFLVKNGKLITPAATDNILEGITRNTVAELAKDLFGIETVGRSVDRSELYLADELFFCGTGAQIAAIGEVDRRPIGDGKPGPITTKIRNTYVDICRGNVPQYHKWLTPVYGAMNGKLSASFVHSATTSTSSVG